MEKENADKNVVLQKLKQSTLLIWLTFTTFQINPDWFTLCCD